MLYRQALLGVFHQKPCTGNLCGKFWFVTGFAGTRYNTLTASMLMHMFYNLMGTLIVDLESRFLPGIMGMIILVSIPMTVSAVTLICLTTNNKKTGFEKMRFVIQRVTEASVTIDGEISGKIGKGYLVLIGVADTDTKKRLQTKWDTK